MGGAGVNNFQQFTPGSPNPNMGQSFAGAVEQQRRQFSTARANPIGATNQRTQNQPAETGSSPNFRPFVANRQNAPQEQQFAQPQGAMTSPALNAAQHPNYPQYGNQQQGNGPTLNPAGFSNSQPAQSQAMQAQAHQGQPTQGFRQQRPAAQSDTDTFPTTPPQLGQPITATQP